MIEYHRMGVCQDMKLLYFVVFGKVGGSCIPTARKSLPTSGRLSLAK
jgi:hypothetical protein